MSITKNTGALVFFFLLAVARADDASVSSAQVWNVGRWQTVTVGDMPAVNPRMAALEPITLLSTRNGVVSGRVLVSRAGAPIEGLQASVGDLVHANGANRIAGAQIVVRFADLVGRAHSWMPPTRFDRLREEPPVRVEPVNPAKRGVRNFTPKHAAATAMAPVWITVRVPTDAEPGAYAGELTLAAKSLPGGSMRLPVRLKVHDWVMPEPDDFRVRTIGWMNPEALAAHYRVDLWSDRHFELMGQSMERMRELGSRHLALTLTVGYSAQGNRDTLVKWVRQKDGSYTYDFTLFDAYCDLAAKKIGHPFPVRLNLWRGPRNGGGGESDDYRHTTVLVRDAESGELSRLEGPTKLGSDAMKAFWQPVMEPMRTRLKARGWFDATGVNWMTYCAGMTEKLAGMVHDIWPDGQWTDVTHGNPHSYKLPDGTRVPIIAQSTVWNEGTLKVYEQWTEGPYPRQYANAFKPGRAFCTHARNHYKETTNPSLWTLRTLHEQAILKGNDGIECLGVDHFPGEKRRGRYRPGSWSAFAQGPNGGTLAILGAGDDGVLATERYEAMREGIQFSEAMVFVQKAIEAGALSGDLLERANRVLDDRAKAYVSSVLYREIDAGGRKVQRFSGVDFGKYADLIRPLDDALLGVATEVAAVWKE